MSAIDATHSDVPEAETDILCGGLQCGDPITLRIKGPDREREYAGFFGGIRDDGGTVLFVHVMRHGLTRCYWPAKESRGLIITRAVAQEPEPQKPK